MTVFRGYNISRRFMSSMTLGRCSSWPQVKYNNGLVLRTYSSNSSQNKSTASDNNALNKGPLAVSFLQGKCSCGSVGWNAVGRSSLNYTCHCEHCRTATRQPSVTVSAFKPDQVTWVNKEGLKQTEGSSIRYHCKKCGDYVGQDGTMNTGLLSLPISLCKSVPDEYLSNMHIYYKERTEESKDGLPKWIGPPYGSIMFPSEINSQAPKNGHDPANGRFWKDVTKISSGQAAPSNYTVTTRDPPANHTTFISPEKVQERVSVKYDPSPGKFVAPKETKWDVIIIGGGHNALVSSAYLSRAGLKVLVLERRHVVGGAAVTEEIIPGFKFSRASYLAGLLRPQIIKDLNLESYGFKYITRDPSSFTPTSRYSGLDMKYLLLGSNEDLNHVSISQFSKKDAIAFPKYEDFLSDVRELVQPLLDGPPPMPTEGSLKERMGALRRILKIARQGSSNPKAVGQLYELFTGPAQSLLDRWFESDILKTTLATDAVIGAMICPSQPGSAYVLLHHVMGEAAGKKGVWAYLEGGMGRLSEAVASSARKSGAEIVVNATVKRILYSDGDNKVKGVVMDDGTELYAPTVLAGCTPYHTFLELLPGLSRDSGNENETSPVLPEYQHHIRFLDHSCGAFKINCAVDRLPNFECFPSPADGSPGPQHFGTIHFESKMEEIQNAYREASAGIPATRPVIEMTIPSSLDKTLAPPGKHVVQLFVQFAPYDIDPKQGSWADPGFKNSFADRVFRIIDEFAPGFSESVIARDVLSPLDLERIFGLHKGNIFHGALGLHQLGYMRPVPGWSNHRTPLNGLYICGSGAHPGGGVMGAAGRNCAQIVLSDLGK